MIRGFFKLVVIAVLFGVCFVAARQMTGKWVSFPHLVKEIRQFIDPEKLKNIELEDTSAITDALRAVGVGFQESHQAIVGCMAEGEAVKARAQASIYRWRDDKGRWVYSDNPRGDGAVEEMALATTGRDYFSLQVSYPAGQVPADIRDALEVKGKGLYDVFADYLGVDKLFKSDIDIQVYGDRAAYEALRNQVAPNLAANTPGFYSSIDNRAVVLHEGSRLQTERTAIHEAAHVVNARLFGFTPKWFNEGMAEYFENIHMRGQLIEIVPDNYWIGSEELAFGLMPLAVLLDAGDSEWNSGERNRFYGNAWALIYFLMEDRNRELATALMLYMNGNRCGIKNLNEVFNQHYPGGVAALERDWHTWFRRGGSKPHRL